MQASKRPPASMTNCLMFHNVQLLSEKGPLKIYELYILVMGQPAPSPAVPPRGRAGQGTGAVRTWSWVCSTGTHAGQCPRVMGVGA